MAWCNDGNEKERGNEDFIPSNTTTITALRPKPNLEIRNITCPSCGHNIQIQDQGGIQDLPGLPAGVKFDPNDIEILEHLEAKVKSDVRKLHPLIDEFIPTLQGENGICYTHPEKLPGVNKDGQIRHFFHRPSKAYTTGTRKRRKVHTDEDGSETRWHKTGKTRPVVAGGVVKGFKKILVLYTNYGRQRKPEKTNWVMHQYHLGSNEEERDGELVVSKVFYQTQPRQCGNSIFIKEDDDLIPYEKILMMDNNNNKKHNNGNDDDAAPTVVDYYINYEHVGHHHHNNHNQNHNSESCSSPHQLIPNMVVQGDSSSLYRFASSSVDGNGNKATLIDRNL